MTVRLCALVCLFTVVHRATTVISPAAWLTLTAIVATLTGLAVVVLVAVTRPRAEPALPLRPCGVVDCAVLDRPATTGRWA